MSSSGAVADGGRHSHAPRAKLKVVVRQLPWTLTADKFKEMLPEAVVPHITYFVFTGGKHNVRRTLPGKCHLAFSDAVHATAVAEALDGKFLIDQKGSRSQLSVEFAPWQRLPRHALPQPPSAPPAPPVDARKNTLADDADFLAFCAELERPAAPTPSAEKWLEQREQQLREQKESGPVIRVTPLMEELRQRRLGASNRRRKEREKREKRKADRRARAATRAGDEDRRDAPADADDGGEDAPPRGGGKAITAVRKERDKQAAADDAGPTRWVLKERPRPAEPAPGDAAPARDPPRPTAGSKEEKKRREPKGARKGGDQAKQEEAAEPQAAPQLAAAAREPEPERGRGRGRGRFGDYRQRDSHAQQREDREENGARGGGGRARLPDAERYVRGSGRGQLLGRRGGRGFGRTHPARDGAAQRDASRQWAEYEEPTAEGTEEAEWPVASGPYTADAEMLQYSQTAYQDYYAAYGYNVDGGNSPADSAGRDKHDEDTPPISAESSKLNAAARAFTPKFLTKAPVSAPDLNTEAPPPSEERPQSQHRYSARGRWGGAGRRQRDDGWRPSDPNLGP